ncbi:hypothetical protein [Massilia sp. H6]|uniref:hypothetical protein n=1 Tax=Massilia sp. H6 TaxID=2970464 RepID=UPI0021676E3E|nr:hypothetical protein [Massilia sp. H6]UVW29494.1 hypothetical protein NRS07_05020 [Massilia sp. H6]
MDKLPPLRINVANYSSSGRVVRYATVETPYAGSGDTVVTRAGGSADAAIHFYFPPVLLLFSALFASGR